MPFVRDYSTETVEGAERQPDPDLVGFRQEIQHRRERANNLAMVEASDIARVFKKPYILRVLQLLTEITTLVCVAVTANLPPGIYGWFDYVIYMTAMSLVVDIIFLVMYYVHRGDSFEWWWFEPLRTRMPKIELVLTAIMALLNTVASILFFANLGVLENQVPVDRLGVLRAASAFMLFTALLWCASMVGAFRRVRIINHLPPVLVPRSVPWSHADYTSI